MKKLFFFLFIILINYNQNAIGMEVELLLEEDRPQTDRFKDLSTEIVKKFEYAFDTVETQKYPGNQQEVGIWPKNYPEKEKGVNNPEDFTQTAFNGIKEFLRDKSLIPPKELHAYIFEYYYWRVLNKMSVKFEDSIQVATDRNNIGFGLFILQALFLVIPGSSHWKDEKYLQYPNILPYEIELSMSVLGMYAGYFLILLPPLCLNPNPLLMHYINYKEFDEDNHPNYVISEENANAGLGARSTKFVIDLLSLKDFRKFAKKAFHEMHKWIEGEDLQRCFLSFMANTAFLTFLMYFMQDDHLPPWNGFQNIFHNLFLAAKAFLIDMGGRTRGWHGINSIFGEGATRSYQLWLTTKVPTDFVMALVLMNLKHFKGFVCGFVKRLSRQSYLQWFFNWARPIFFFEHDPAKFGGTLMKMATPMTICFLGAGLFEGFQGVQRLHGDSNYTDYGDGAGIWLFLASMYPIKSMSYLNFWQLKNMKYETVTGAFKMRLSYITKRVRNNSGSLIFYGLHTLVIGYMNACVLGLGSPADYFTAILETLVNIPGYWGIIVTISMVVKSYTAMVKASQRPVDDEKYGVDIRLSHTSYFVTWLSIFSVCIGLYNWHENLGILEGESYIYNHMMPYQSDSYRRKI